MAWNVVIAGGGFGGLYAARTLEKVLPAQSARVTLVNDVNFMLYTPLLPGAAAGTLEPRHVVVPLREQLHRTDLRLGCVVGARPDERTLQVRNPEGKVEDLRYDHLIVALGSITRVFPIPGLAEHGMGFKTLPEAIALRNRLLLSFEIAEAMEDAREREAYLTFVFVGAGYAGVEGLAELQDFATDAIELYPRCRVTGTRFVLVEARDRIMGEIPEPLAQFATRELRGRGIEVRTQTTLKEVREDSVLLSTGERIPTRTVAWTAGVRAHPVVAELGLPLSDSGRIRVDSYLQVEGYENVWAIGDAAAVPDAAKRYQAPTPPTAQHAMRQGRRVARNVAATIGSGGRPRKFTYKTLGVFVDMGRGQAVAQTVGIRWRGPAAWWLARTYHLLLMPSMRRRARLLADWTIGLFFGRDASELGMLGHPPSLQAQSSGGTAAGLDGGEPGGEG
ncbi:MAG TPA: NAD(P)/FAD-dependent oxidoreductase [Capillimicrobium sp.]|nr:NAD(P)/FAD-dependent oxidoreductase [Capillimicrobium sp.]